jgi:hypothetical protein
MITQLEELSQEQLKLVVKLFCHIIERFVDECETDLLAKYCLRNEGHGYQLGDFFSEGGADCAEVSAIFDCIDDNGEFLPFIKPLVLAKIQEEFKKGVVK